MVDSVLFGWAVLLFECLFHTVVKNFQYNPCLEKTPGLGVTSANVSLDAIEVRLSKRRPWHVMLSL